MSNRTFRVVINKDPDGGYVADVPTLKHCISYGDTIEEAMENIQEAVEGVLLVMEEEGLPIFDDSHSIEFTLTLPSDLLQNRAS
jgi:antitoxin HicB